MMAPFNHIPNFKETVLAAIALVTVTSVSYFVYNVFLHPLRAFPGPLIHRATVIGKCVELLRGNMPHRVKQLHKKYGPVVRVSPNELSFIDPRAWQDIYTRNKFAGKYEFPQDDDFYNMLKTEHHAIHELPRDEHDKVKKLLSRGFSEKAMKAQEPIFQRYVTLLLQRLREKSASLPEDKKKTAVNMRDYLAYTTFDIIGILSFGSDFGCLQGDGYHPWIRLITAGLRDLAVIQVLNTWGVLIACMFIMNLIGRGGKARKQHFELSTVRTKERVAIGTGQNDFMDGLIESGMPFDTLKMNASLLILAGSETTATLLAGAVYFLTMNPDIQEKVQKEVREHFESEEDINMISVGRLTYMMAVLNETMRIYPPAASSQLRKVPKGGAIVAGYHVPGGTVVGVYHYAMYHSPTLFHDPEKFDPERFFSRSGVYSNDRTDACQPFLLGPRGCIGQNLAYAEMRLILARLIWNFDMSLADSSRDWITQRNYLLWEKPDLDVYIEQRVL